MPSFKLCVQLKPNLYTHFVLIELRSLSVWTASQLHVRLSSIEAIRTPGHLFLAGFSLTR